MSWIKQIREKAGASKLRKLLKGKKRTKSMLTFDEARIVGVLFNADNPMSYDAVRKFIANLSAKHIRLKVYGYSSGKTTHNIFLSDPVIRTFNAKQVDFSFFPTTYVCDDFTISKFDILVNLDTTQQFPLYVLSALADATFKIGCYTKTQSCYDLMMDVNISKPVDYILDQIYRYLDMFKNSSSKAV